jgi:riboflavin kinase/FMN adenylyltransferase
METHILNFSEDLYDSMLGVSFVRRIREERCFENPSALRRQLIEDEHAVEELFRGETGEK